jgi:hypothetical protein
MAAWSWTEGGEAVAHVIQGVLRRDGTERNSVITLAVCREVPMLQPMLMHVPRMRGSG